MKCTIIGNPKTDTVKINYRLMSITSDWHHIISLLISITFICFWYAFISLLVASLDMIIVYD